MRAFAVFVAALVVAVALTPGLAGATAGTPAASAGPVDGGTFAVENSDGSPERESSDESGDDGDSDDGDGSSAGGDDGDSDGGDDTADDSSGTDEGGDTADDSTETSGDETTDDSSGDDTADDTDGESEASDTDDGGGGEDTDDTDDGSDREDTDDADDDTDTDDETDADESDSDDTEGTDDEDDTDDTDDEDDDTDDTEPQTREGQDGADGQGETDGGEGDGAAGGDATGADEPAVGPADGAADDRTSGGGSAGEPPNDPGLPEQRTVPPAGVGSSPAGVTVAAGALAAGVLARRLVLSASGGAVSASANVGSAAVLAGPRGAAQAAVASGSEFAGRARGLVTDWGGRILGTAGYAKWAGEDPLAHDVRADLYDHVRAEPGTYLSAFGEARTLDVSLGTIRYHLDILEREGLVTSETVGGRRRFYPVGVSPDELEIALDSDATRAILDALAESADTVSGLADRIDRDPSTVSHHLSRLEDADLVERERDGRAVVTRLTPGVRRALAEEPVADTETAGTPADD